MPRRRRPVVEIRQRAVAAAAACFREIGIADTSVDDIVRTSGVARSTLYRQVGDRNDLLLAVTLAEIEQLRTDLIARLDERTAVADVLVEGVLHAVDLVGESAVLRELVARPGLLAAELSEQALEALSGQFRDFVEPLFADRHAGIRADLQVDVAVEYLVRTIISLATLGGRVERSRRDRREYLRRTLVPVFVPDR